MTRWHEDHHAADEDTSKLDALDEWLKRLAREAKEDEIERQLTKKRGSRRKGEGDGR